MKELGKMAGLAGVSAAMSVLNAIAIGNTALTGGIPVWALAASLVAAVASAIVCLQLLRYQ
jgi:hypothetical protein